MVKSHRPWLSNLSIDGLQGTKILNESTLILVTPNVKECKTNVNDVKPCNTLKLTENAWNSFLNPIKTKCQFHDYNLRSGD